MASDYDINRQERGQSIPISHAVNAVNISRKDEAPPLPPLHLSLSDLQASMEQELEKRKTEWEKDVSFMKSDFFNRPKTLSPNIFSPNSLSPNTLSPRALAPDGSREIELRASPSPRNSCHNSTQNLHDENNGYYTCSDGTKIYRLQFDLHEYEPQDISVRMEGSNLCISATHEKSGTNFRNSAQFNKSVHIPDNVDIDSFTARLSTEGTLTIKAPVNPDPSPNAVPPLSSLFNIPLTKQTNIQTVNYPNSNSGFQCHSLPNSEASPKDYHIRKHTVLPISHNFTTSMTQSYPTSPRKTRVQHPVYIAPRDFDRNKKRNYFIDEPIAPKVATENSSIRYRDPLVVICDDQRKMKLTVPVDSSLTADQIEIVFDGANIAVHTDGVLLRQYTCPETIKFSTLRAHITTDGRILISASCDTNKDHDKIIASIENDLPEGSQPCRIRLLYHGVMNELTLD